MFSKQETAVLETQLYCNMVLIDNILMKMKMNKAIVKIV